MRDRAKNQKTFSSCFRALSSRLGWCRFIFPVCLRPDLVWLFMALLAFWERNDCLCCCIVSFFCFETYLQIAFSYASNTRHIFCVGLVRETSAKRYNDMIAYINILLWFFFLRFHSTLLLHTNYFRRLVLLLGFAIGCARSCSRTYEEIFSRLDNIDSAVLLIFKCVCVCVRVHMNRRKKKSFIPTIILVLPHNMLQHTDNKRIYRQILYAAKKNILRMHVHYFHK